jgi:hypothetical protein
VLDHVHRQSFVSESPNSGVKIGDESRQSRHKAGRSPPRPATSAAVSRAAIPGCGYVNAADVDN